MNNIEILEEAKKHWECMRDNCPLSKLCYKPLEEKEIM